MAAFVSFCYTLGSLIRGGRYEHYDIMAADPVDGDSDFHSGFSHLDVYALA